MERERFEVCIVGGGPAGSAASLRLAQLGHRICLIEGCAFPRAHVGESLTPGVLPLLDGLGVCEAVLREGFLCPGKPQIRWDGSDAKAVGSGPSGTSLQVDRGRFDALLLQAAAAAGTRVFQPARARGVKASDSGWQVELTGAAEPCGISADYLVDASGRRGFCPGSVSERGCGRWHCAVASKGGTVPTQHLSRHCRTPGAGGRRSPAVCSV